MDHESTADFSELSAEEKEKVQSELVERLLAHLGLEIRVLVWNEGTYRTVSLKPTALTAGERGDV